MILRLVLGFCFLCFVNCNSGESESVFEETSTLPIYNCTDTSTLPETAQLKDKVIASDENDKSSDDSEKKIVSRSTEEEVQVNKDNSTAEDRDSRQSYEPNLRSPNDITYEVNQGSSLHINIPVQDSQNQYMNIIDNVLYEKMQDKLSNFNPHTTTATLSEDCLPIITITYVMKEILQFVKQHPHTLNLIINEIEDEINEKPPLFWFHGEVKTEIKSLLIQISQLNRFNQPQSNAQPECSASVVRFLEQRDDILLELRKHPFCLYLLFGCRSKLVHHVYSKTTEESYCNKIKYLMDEPKASETSKPNSLHRPQKYGSKEVHNPDSLNMPDLYSQEVYILHTPEPSMETVRPKVTQKPFVSEFIINDRYKHTVNEHEFPPSEYTEPEIYVINPPSKIIKPKEHKYPNSSKFPGTFVTIDTEDPEPAYVEETKPLYIEKPDRFNQPQPNVQPECSASVVRFLEQRDDILSELRKHPFCLHFLFGCHSNLVHHEYSRTTEQLYCKKIQDLMEEPKPYEPNKPNSHLRPQKYVSKEVHKPDSQIHMPDLYSQEVYILHTPEPSMETGRPKGTQKPFVSEFIVNDRYKQIVNEHEFSYKYKKPKEHKYPNSSKLPGSFVTKDTEEPKPTYVEETEPIYAKNPEYVYTVEPESIYSGLTKFIDPEKRRPVHVENPESNFILEPEPIHTQPSQLIDPNKRRPVHVENPESNFILEPESIFIQPFKITDNEKSKPIYVENYPYNIQEMETMQVKPKPIFVDQPKPNYIDQAEPEDFEQAGPNYIENPESNYIQQPKPNIILQPKTNYVVHSEPFYAEFPEPNYIEQPDANYIQPIYVKQPEPNYFTPSNIEKPEHIYINELNTIHVKHKPIYVGEPEPNFMEEINYFEQPKHSYTEPPEPFYLDQLESISADQSKPIYVEEPESIYFQNPKLNLGAENPESMYVQQYNPIYMDTSKPAYVKESEPIVIIEPESVYIEELRPDIPVETIHKEENVPDINKTPKSMKILTLIEEELVDSRAVEVLLKLLNQTENNILTPSQVQKLLILIKPNYKGLIPQKNIDIASALVRVDTVEYLSHNSIDIIFSLIPDDIENGDIRAIEIIHEILLQTKIKYLTKHDIDHMLSILRQGSTEEVQSKRLDFVLFILKNMVHAPKLINKLLKLSENHDIIQSKYWDVISYLHKNRLLSYKLLEVLITLVTEETTGNIDPLIVKNVFLLLESYKNDHPNIIIDIHNILYPEYIITPNINMKEVPENLKELLYYLMNSGTSQLANDQVSDVESLQTHYLLQGNKQHEDQERLQTNLLKKILEWEQNNNSPPKPQAKDHGFIELTYRLKHHKPLLYHPVYYVKYKMPMVDFLRKVHELLSANPQLTTDPAKLLQELIVDGSVSAISPDLKGVPKEDILRLTFNGGNLIQTKVLDEKSLNLNEQIQIIHNLSSDITPQEILQQNEINAAQYYTNVQRTVPSQVNMGTMSSLRNMGSISNLLPYKLKNSSPQGFNTTQYYTNAKRNVPIEAKMGTMSSVRNVGIISHSLPNRFKDSYSQGVNTLNQPQGFNAVQYYTNVQGSVPNQVNMDTMSRAMNNENIDQSFANKFKDSSSQEVNKSNQRQGFNLAQYQTNVQDSVPSQVKMDTISSVRNVGNIGYSLPNKFKDSSSQGANTLNQPQGFNAAQYRTIVQESVPSQANVGTMNSVRNVENGYSLPNRFKDSSSEEVNTLYQSKRYNAAQYGNNVQIDVPSQVNMGTMSRLTNIGKTDRSLANKFKDSFLQEVNTLNQPQEFNAVEYYNNVQGRVPNQANMGTTSSVRNVGNIDISVPNRFKDSSSPRVHTFYQSQGLMYKTPVIQTSRQLKRPLLVHSGDLMENKR